MLSAVAVAPNSWMIVPFGVLLAGIALGPLLAPHAWSRHYPKLALGLGALTLVYYLAGLHAHERVGQTALEYFSFICLVGSLYVVSGGIHLSIQGGATPWENTVFLAVGSVLANVFGTTGASMLFIRPWIRMNKFRIAGHHTVFFIFTVSNVGGALTPIGDPQYSSGISRGFPSSWTMCFDSPSRACCPC